MTVLRLIGRLSFIIVGNVIYALLTCGLAWALAPRGLVVLSLAWPVGLTTAAAVMAVPVLRWAKVDATSRTPWRRPEGGACPVRRPR